MESQYFQLTGTEVSEENYLIHLKTPFRSELLQILEPPSERIKTETTFSDGILATVPHSICLHLFRSGTNIVSAGLYIRLSPKTGEIVQVCHPVELMFLSDYESSGDPEGASLYPSSQPLDCQMDGYEYFEYSCAWPENPVHAVITIQVSKRQFPALKLANEEKGAREKKPENSCGQSGHLDTKPFFMSPDLSDMIIGCGGESFHVHRLVLAGKSEVFTAMFRLPLRESQEGRIVLQDMEPSTLKELLRFMYTGEIESTEPTEMMELYKAADRYDVRDLLNLCESNLIDAVTVDNVMSMYDLASSRPQSELAKKARQVIAWNKGTFAADAESFKNFTCKYPELVFELFKM